MNIETPVLRRAEIEMSADGEVLIPEDIRRAAGLVAGMAVVVGINDRGEAVIMNRTQAKRRGETREQRRARIGMALTEAGSGRYSTGQSTAEVMAELRGDATP